MSGKRILNLWIDNNEPPLTNVVWIRPNWGTYYYDKGRWIPILGDTIHYEIATSTSSVSNPQNNVLYLIGPTGGGSDKYEEYVYPNSTIGWIKIGDTSLDLSDYITIDQLSIVLSDYVPESDLIVAFSAKIVIKFIL